MIKHASSRRAFLKGTAGAVVGSAALSSTVSAQETSNGDGNTLKAWFSNTDNATSVVDRRGASEVAIKVGAEANGGAFGFNPAAVRINPGTKVVWEWTGNGGSHNVVAENGAFESQLYSTPGETFEYTPSETGVIRYACSPHEPMGMKGALIVGSVSASFGSEQETEVTKRSFDGWLEETDNHTHVVDKRGEDDVVIDVGAAGNGGTFAFEPAAVRVTPGTNVVWRWRNAPGSYNVADLDGAFRSEFVSEPGHEFEQTLYTEAVVKYGCEAYADLGMKGVVVVGNGKPGVQVENVDTGMLVGAGVGIATFLSPLGFGAMVHRNQQKDGPSEGHTPRPHE